MDKIEYLIKTLKNFIYLIVDNLILLKVLCIIILILILKYSRIKLYLPKEKNLLSYKITNFSFTCSIGVFYVILVIGFLFLYRIFNLFHKINLKESYYVIFGYFKQNSVSVVIVNSILIVLLVLIILILIKLLKNFFYKEITKLHIYLFQYESENFSYHSNICTNIKKYYGDHVINLYKYMTKYFYKNYAYKKLKLVYNNIGIMLIVILFIYDLFFNNFIITKIFYIYPLIYIYTIWASIGDHMSERDCFLDKSLSNFYYKKSLYLNEKGVCLENLDFYSDADLKELHEHILRNFKIEIFTANKIIDNKI